MSLPKHPKQWTKQSFVISTDKTLLSLSALNAAFDSDYIYWARPYDEAILQAIITNSFCFGLYKVAEDKQSDSRALQQIGFARLITDSFTFAYLTDVYVLPEYRGSGLGGWMIDCVREVLEPLPWLRWAMLRTGAQKSVEWYRERLGMEILDNGDADNGGVLMGRRGGGNYA